VKKRKKDAFGAGKEGIYKIIQLFSEAIVRRGNRFGHIFKKKALAGGLWKNRKQEE